MIYYSPSLFHITVAYKDSKTAEWKEYTPFAVELTVPQEKKLNLHESKNLDVSKTTKQLLHTKKVLMQRQAWNTKKHN